MNLWPSSRTIVRTICVLLLVATSQWLPVTSAVAEPPGSNAVWPSFQNGGQVNLGERSLPRRWSADENVAWEAELPGLGQSTPLVDRELVYATATSGPNKEICHLVALNLASGKQQWQLELENPTPVENTNYVSRAAPTGVLHDRGVIALFEGGLVVSVSNNGEIRWQRNLVADYGPIGARHGLASSLEQRGPHVFVSIQRGEEPYLLCLDKTTGETVWKADGLEVTSWSTPRLIETSGGQQLIFSGSGQIRGYDPATGNERWTFEDIANNSTCTPMPVGDGSTARFLIGASDGRGEEAAGSGASSNGLLEVRENDAGSFVADFVWRAEKATSSFGSPIAAGGSAWFVNRAGVLFRLDLNTGEQQQTERIESGSIWATPIATDKHLYLFGQKGTTTVLDLDDGKPIANNSLGREGETLYAVAAAGPKLLFRFGERLIAVEDDRP